jgi:hypothetical protein
MTTSLTPKERFRISGIFSIVLLLMTLTFIGFFFANPFGSGFTFLGLIQAISTLGWISLIVVPPFVLYPRKDANPAKSVWFLIATLLWPASVLAIRITLLVQSGNPYLGYLVQYPLFLFSDIFVPVVYILIWRGSRR